MAVFEHEAGIRRGRHPLRREVVATTVRAGRSAQLTLPRMTKSLLVHAQAHVAVAVIASHAWRGRYRRHRGSRGIGRRWRNRRLRMLATGKQHHSDDD